MRTTQPYVLAMTPSKSAQPLCFGLVYGVLFDTTTQPYVLAMTPSKSAQPLCLRLVYGVLFACTTSTAVSSDADFALGILCFVCLIRQGLINGNLLAAGFEVFFLLTKSYQALLRENLVLVLGSFCLLYANWITKTEYSACHFRRRAEDFAVSASFPMISPGSVERTLHLTSE